MKKFRVAVLFALLGLFASLLLEQSATLKLFESRSWDVRQRFAASQTTADSRIKLILIDQSSLEFVSKNFDITWPWPREYQAAIVDFVRRGGANVIGFDLIFTEPSGYGQGDDQQLADATERNGKVIHAAVVRASAIASSDGQAAEVGDVVNKLSANHDLAARQLAVNWSSRLSPAQYLLLNRTAKPGGALLLPTPTILAKANSIGSVTGNFDADGTARFAALAGKVNDVLMPTLPMAVALISDAPIFVEQISRKVADNNQLAIRFQAPQSYQSFTAAAIINSELALREGRTPQIDPQVFADSLVIVGVSAPGLFDFKPTSIDEKLLGVELNAHILDNILHGSFARVFSAVETILISAVFALLIAISTVSTSATLVMLFRQVCLLAFWPSLAFAASLHGMWLPLTTPFAAGMLVALTSFAYVYSHEGKQRRFVTTAFKQYVSPAVIESIIADPKRLSLSGDTREVTVFFSDVEGFTSLSERLSPAVLSSALNLYLTELTDIILEFGGTVDKYVGDAIIAIWNAPLEDSQHAYHAAQAAIKCQQRLIQLASTFEESCGAKFRTRIGIHTGPAMVGNFGSKQRFNYTAIGDTINFAARLENLNKYFSTSVLLSERTHQQLAGQVFCRYVGEVKVVGKEQYVKIYNPLIFEARDDFVSFEQAISLVSSGQRERAAAIFERLHSTDPVAKVYSDRLQKLADGATLDRWVFESK